MDMLATDEREERMQQRVELEKLFVSSEATAYLALDRIRTEKLYELTHESFDQYCSEFHQLSRVHVDRCIRYAKVITLLSGRSFDVMPANEGQARVLSRFLNDPEQLVEKWMSVVTALEGSEERLTADFIENIVCPALSDQTSNAQATQEEPAVSEPGESAILDDGEESAGDRSGQPLQRPKQMEDAVQSAMRAAEKRIQKLPPEYQDQARSQFKRAVGSTTASMSEVTVTTPSNAAAGLEQVDQWKGSWSQAERKKWAKEQEEEVLKTDTIVRKPKNATGLVGFVQMVLAELSPRQQGIAVKKLSKLTVPEDAS